MIRRVAITGPESTGKTWLAKKLAGYYNTVWVAEYAREYLQQNGSNYSYNDILEIAKGQKTREEQLLLQAKKVLFSDTDPLVTKIWSEVVFGKCDPWIENEIQNNPYDLYLLCYPDIPWEPDPLRENPDNRLGLFELYLKELSNRKLNYRIVEGEGEQRFQTALKFVEELLKE